ncbi:phosphoenolpyruvate--protein phosphotransferase [Ammonicoccus fulvus]|uniref:phosphoenolpyruvate--protein phosphotransferase n=1 Tax=Ammonicoccus fulvus TaxID=3138240 RepID=A0ABZ3FQG5_9ACTN
MHAKARTSSQGSGLGVAIGPAIIAKPDLHLNAYEPGDRAKERRRLDKVLAKADKQLRKLAAQPVRANAAIFGAQRELLHDRRITDAAFELVDSGEPATTSWTQAVERHRPWLQGLPDAPGQLELADSVEHRILALLTGTPTEFETTEPGILVVPVLDPGMAVTLDPKVVLGIVTIGGGPTGHGVIIARSRGIPIFAAAGADVSGVEEDDIIAFIARGERRIAVNPEADELAEFERTLAALEELQAEAQAHAHEPAYTSDGTLIEIYANVLAEADAGDMVAKGADGWVIRTEILFGGSPHPPTVEEQEQAFLRLGRTLGNKRMIVRTWDIGGDKTVPFLPLDQEENPFLGVRGLRVFRNRPELLIDQVEAVCRAARFTPLSLMFPMVTTVEELDWALGLLDDVVGRVGRPDSLQVGIMVEVPAAALRARLMTQKLDFVSIGTNDLTQYTTAAERGNAALHVLADPLDPAVLRLIRLVADESRRETLVAICGDANTDPDVAALFVGLGVRELTPGAPAVPMVKARLRTSSLAELTTLADRALACTDAHEVRELIRSKFR